MTQKKHIWIIGASSGIGAALCQTLAQKGHAIAASARRKDALQAIVANCPAKAQHLSIPLDVTQSETLQKAFETILSRWDRIDSVIYMAGDYTPMDLQSMRASHYENLFNVNVLGAFRLTEMMLAYYEKQSFRGQLALCASVAGYRGLPHSQPYGATKAALINLAESLATEVGHQIDIKLICPGFVKTRLTDKNTFSMPMRISPEQAAKVISKKLDSRAFQITTPWLFTSTMKLLRLIPFWLYAWLARWMTPKDDHE